MPRSARCSESLKEPSPYVPSRFAVCWDHRPELGPDHPTPSIEPSRILPLLPPAVEDLLRDRGFLRACSVMSTEEARGIAYALDAAGLEKRGGGEGPGSYNEFDLGYRFAAPGQRRPHLHLFRADSSPRRVDKHRGWVGQNCQRPRMRGEQCWDTRAARRRGLSGATGCRRREARPVPPHRAGVPGRRRAAQAPRGVKRSRAIVRALCAASVLERSGSYRQTYLNRAGSRAGAFPCSPSGPTRAETGGNH
jgi:hypothetical protein